MRPAPKLATLNNAAVTDPVSGAGLPKYRIISPVIVAFARVKLCRSALPQYSPPDTITPSKIALPALYILDKIGPQDKIV